MWHRLVSDNTLNGKRTLVTHNDIDQTVSVQSSAITGTSVIPPSVVTQLGDFLNLMGPISVWSAGRALA